MLKDQSMLFFSQIPFQELIGAFERYDVVSCDILQVRQDNVSGLFEGS